MHEPARLPHPAPTCKRADTSPETTIVEEDHLVNVRPPAGERAARRRSRHASWSTRTFPSSPVSTPSLSRNAARRGPDGSIRSVLDLERDAEAVGRAAQRRPSAPAFATHPEPRRISSVSASPGPRTSSGRARIAAAAREPPSSCSRRENAFAIRSRVSAYVDDPAAVDRRRQRRGVDLGRGGHLGEHRFLARMSGEAVALGGPAVLAAEQEHRGVLSGAVVLEPSRLGAALELVLARRRLREQRADGLELIGAVKVRRAGDGDLGFGEIGAQADDRQRLDRLRRAAEVRQELGIADLLDDRAVRDSDGVDAVAAPRRRRLAPRPIAPRARGSVSACGVRRGVGRRRQHASRRG